MNQPTPSQPTMYDLVSSLTGKEYYEEDLNPVAENEELASIMPSLSPNSPVGAFVYNHKTLKYEYVSPSIKNLMGYDHIDFMEGGLKFAMAMVDPEHNRLFNKHIIPIMFRYYFIYAVKGKVLDLKFSYTFKIQRKNGEYMWAFHDMTTLKTNSWGAPKYTMMFVNDVTELKKDDNVDIVISLKGEDGLYKPIYSRTYNGFVHNFKFSSRELEILAMIAQGNTSKDIAQKLALSPHTVNTHRKNMMEKSQVKNSSELVLLAIKKGLISERSVGTVSIED